MLSRDNNKYNMKQQVKTCISQRSKWLTKYNIVIITESYPVILVLNFWFLYQTVNK